MKGLDSIDRRILFELDRNGRIAETKLAKIIRRSREVVRYRIRKLEQAGIILRYSCFINVAKLGYHGYKVYLKMKGKPERKKEFSEHIRSRKDIFWFGIADGAWDIGLTFFAKDSGEFFSEKNLLFSEFSDLIIQKDTGILVEPIVFGKKFLLEKDTRSSPIHLFGRVEEHRIDETDRKVLGALLRNGRTSAVELAREIGSSPDVVRARMKRLEQKGIIAKYYAVLDHNKLGMEFYKSFLYFESLSPEDERKLYEICRHDPNIIHMVRQITPWDIELEVMVRDYREYNRIINSIKEVFPDSLRNIESAIMSEDYVFPAEKTVFD
jgi:Lrp/AsnC family leucine-responsive transcriptional regulator